MKSETETEGKLCPSAVLTLSKIGRAVGDHGTAGALPHASHIQLFGCTLPHLNHCCKGK